MTRAAASIARRSSFAAVAAAALVAQLSVISCSADEVADAVLEWVNQSKHNAYINEKLEIRHLTPEDETSPLGVFAKADLERNEKLMRIPRELYIQIDNADKVAEAMNDEAEEEGSMVTYVEGLCALAKKVMREMKLGEKSDYAPYVRYLNQQRRGQLPATWSVGGKSLLRKLLDNDSAADILDWIDTSFKGTCFDMTDDPFEEHVVALTKARCYDTALIPIWDMVNHDNGKINTNHTSIYNKDGVVVWASQRIAAGDEIFATYDDCTDCGDLSSYWGTPEILKDFGFVENYPHRFSFSKLNLWWEVWEKSKDGEKEVRWDDYYKEADDDDDEFYGPPNKEAINFMRIELEKIKKFSPEEFDCGMIRDVSMHECQTIVQYKDALTEGLLLALEAAGGGLQQNDDKAEL